MVRVWMLVALLLAASPSLWGQTAADFTAPSVTQSPLQYPPAAVAAGEEGTVVVALHVDARGQPHDASIHESSGHQRLDEAALRSISQWSFRPATRKGEPVAQRILVPVAFELKREEGGTASPSVASLVASLLCLLGGLVGLFGFVWSIVLAKRRSILWLSGMVALWIVTYPIFVAVHWSVAKRTLVVVLGAVLLFCLGFYIAPSP